MNQDVSIITALFNINRERSDGRSWQKYLDWFEFFLKLRCPLIIFTSSDLIDFIMSRRKNLKTKIIISDIEKIPYFYLYGQIEEIISSQDFKNNMKDINRIECQNPLYSIIQFSKFYWIKEASIQNYFNSKIFLWLDAGAGRFFKNYSFKKDFPSFLGNSFLNNLGDTFLVQMNYDFYPDLYNKEKLEFDYLYENRSFVLGSLFGGNKIIIQKVFDLMDDLLINKMIKNNIINVDQVALAFIVKNNPQYFSIYCRKDKIHLSLFNFLSRS